MGNSLRGSKERSNENQGFNHEDKTSKSKVHVEEACNEPKQMPPPSDAKQRLFPKNKDRHKELETEVKQISCNVKPPPTNVKRLHELIMEKIDSKFISYGYELSRNGESPTVVTVVNVGQHAQLENDIQRGLTAAELTSSESENIILIRIKPTNNTTKKVQKDKSGNYILDLVFLADQDNKKLHDCNHNDEQYVLLLEHFGITGANFDQKAAGLKEKVDMKKPTVDNESIRMSEIAPRKKMNIAHFKDLISCNVKPPPVNGKRLHDQIMEMINSTFASSGYELSEDGESPTLVTVVNAGQNPRLDIRRDMAAANLTNSESANVILLRIKPTTNPSLKVVKTKDYALDLVFFSDLDNKTLHDCDHNTQECNSLMEYFLN